MSDYARLMEDNTVLTAEIDKLKAENSELKGRLGHVMDEAKERAAPAASTKKATAGT